MPRWRRRSLAGENEGKRSDRKIVFDWGGCESVIGRVGSSRMGNQITCMAKGLMHKSKKSSKNEKHSSRKSKGLSSLAVEEALLKQEVLSMTNFQQQQQQQRLVRAMSQREGRSAPRQGALPRSASSRARSTADPLVEPTQLINGSLRWKDVDKLETKHFVLIHGGGHGAWCWYKVIPILEQAGFVAAAIDLTGSGRECHDPNEIKSLAQYSKPLTEYMEKLSDTEKVMLVGHNVGGACISYAMELFPKKVAKAIFIAAAMVVDGQRAFDIFSTQPGEENLLSKSQRFNYGNGPSTTPTSLEFHTGALRDVFYNLSPSKDVALAAVSIRAVPVAPVMEKITLTKEKYGSVRRFFVMTADDKALPSANQQSIISQNPPEETFMVKGSDHSPFFSKPHAVCKILFEIASLELPKVDGPFLRSYVV